MEIVQSVITCLTLLQDWLLMALALSAKARMLFPMLKSIQILASSQIKTLDTDTLVDLPLLGTTIGASSGKQRDISILDF